MEIIKNIKEVSDVYFDNEWDTYDGYLLKQIQENYILS